MSATPRHRWGAAVALAMAGVLMATPAVALDDIRDRIREVERQEAQKAQDQAASQDRAEDLEHDLEETSAELVAADKRLKDTTAKVEAARIALTEADDELAAAEAEQVRIEGELDVAYANEAKIEGSLADNAAAQQETRVAVGSIARESYKAGGLGNLALTLEMLSGEGDAIQEMSMARTVMRVQDSTLERLSTQLAQETAEQDRLAGVRRDIALLLAEAEANTIRKQEARDRAELAKTDLEDLEAQQARDKEALAAEIVKLEEHLAKEQAAADAIQDELATLAQEKYGLKQDEAAEKERIAEAARQKAEAERQAQIEQEAKDRAARDKADREQAERDRADRERARQPSPAPAPAPAPSPAPAPAPQPEPPVPAPPPPAAAGVLSHPVNAPTTSEFGWRMHPVLGYARLHAGLDYGAACGTAVRAPASGTIIGTTYNSGGGNIITVDHGVHQGVNLVTRYLHLESYERTSGSVDRGDILGYVGTTGTSTGCHLHFETRENGVPVNPRNWL